VYSGRVALRAVVNAEALDDVAADSRPERIALVAQMQAVLEDRPVAWASVCSGSGKTSPIAAATIVVRVIAASLALRLRPLRVRCASQW